MMRVCAVPLLFCCAAFAQEFRGSFSGNVRDAQGAAVAKARVVATATATGVKSETLSEDSGAYTIPFLAPGEYQISAEAVGFKKFVRAGVSLGMGEHPVIDVQMEVGAISDSVTVMADSPLIEAANASIGQVITSEEVEDMPTNGRTPLMLAQLALGAVSTVEPGTQVRPFDNNTPASFSLGGSTSGTNELLYNGAPNGAFRSQLAYSPPQGSVQQVRVSVFESDASFGHTGGGTANLVTKSGTNQIHGELYEFNQVSNLEANQFFYNARGVPRPVFRYNQYGAQGGGPLWIPKVFNGKDRVFWMFAWEGLQDSDPANSPRETGSPINFATVPTAAERQGDFSALLKVGANYQIYDPATGAVNGTHVQRDPFPNNVIPSSRLNPIALKYLQYFPQPNNTTYANGFQNYLVDAIDSDVYNNELARLDVALSEKNKLTADFRHSFRTQDKNNYFGNIAEGNYLYRKNQGASLDDVYTISPTIFMDVRANWTRFIEITNGTSEGFDATSLGFPSYIAARSEEPVMPHIVFTNTTVTSGSYGSFQDLGFGGDATNTYDIFQLFADVIKLHGNHAFKVGADVRDTRWSAYTAGNSAGTYTFGGGGSASTSTSNIWTNGPLNNAAPSPMGMDLASFLLGLPSSGSFDVNAQNTVASKYYAFFIQDDWRARPNLTLNLGLRFEHETPATERYNRGVNGFDPLAQNGIAAAAAAAFKLNPLTSVNVDGNNVPVNPFTALGGLTFAGSGNRDLYHTESSPISPRFGFAWTPAKLGGKTVLRGGFAAFFVPITIQGNSELNSGTTVTLDQAGFSQTTQVVATNNSFVSPAATLSDPFPNGILYPAGTSAGAATFLGQQVVFFNPHIRNPYDLRWNFGVQRQLPGQMVLEIAYIGNHALHLPINTQLDYIPRQYLTTQVFRDNSLNSTLTGTVSNPLQGLLPNSTSLNGSTVALQQLLIPFPQYPVPGAPQSTSNGVLMQNNGAGSSYFQSLNVRIQKRLTNGLTLINNFSWNSLIERVSYLNDSDPAPEKRVSNDTRPLREVLAAVYAIPVGRGRRLNLQSRWVDALFGGWGLNGNMVLQTGPMIGTFGNVIYLGGPLNLNPNQPNGVSFDTTRFVTASSAQPVFNVRMFDTQFSNLRRAASENLDLSLTKDFRFAERHYMQLRFETFNTTNHVTFGAPNVSPTSSAFGSITTQSNSPRYIQLGGRFVW
ncbi:MAG TPA: carboxypeptidase regulatory-like domain-containing protein [Bryobacteraceae bacterium]|nr:carboxypeptidase regulatory-like domain-containing protein [Bryobacteraceae bacterium]